MDNSLKFKNIETFLVDFLIIITCYFITSIEIESITYVALILITYLILIIGKRPPKNLLLMFLYAVSVFIPITVLLVSAKSILFDFNLNSISLISVIILILAIISFILFLVTLPSKNKTYTFLQTFIIPVLFTVLVLSTNYMTGKYSESMTIVLGIYIPLRFLMIYKEPVRWYQFILLPIAMYFAFTSAFSQGDNPVRAVWFGSSRASVELAFSEYGDYEHDKIVKIEVVKTHYTEKLNKGDYFLIVTNIVNNQWRIDKYKSIEYCKSISKYHYSDSINFHRLLDILKSGQRWEINQREDLNGFAKYDLVSKSEDYCDTASRLIQRKHIDEALDKLQIAEEFNHLNSEVYLQRALAFIELNENQDSICNNLQKAVELYNMEALKYYREYCLEGK